MFDRFTCSFTGLFFLQTLGKNWNEPNRHACNQAVTKQTLQHQNNAVPYFTRFEDYPSYQVTSDLQTKINFLLNKTVISVDCTGDVCQGRTDNPTIDDSSAEIVGNTMSQEERTDSSVNHGNAKQQELLISQLLQTNFIKLMQQQTLIYQQKEPCEKTTLLEPLCSTHKKWQPDRKEQHHKRLPHLKTQLRLPCVKFQLRQSQHH